MPSNFILYVVLLSFRLRLAYAATAEQWRGRSIYQIMTDRFALPNGSDPNACDPVEQTWCGGKWNTIQTKLDYIQNAGFTAIWISPVNQNYLGQRTVYGDAYHGYWPADISQLNAHFGTAEDLKALSAEVHRRNMYLMVDIVVNNVMSTSITPDYSTYLFNDSSLYHSYCPIQWGNTTSEQTCWLGDLKVPLPDLNTTHPAVISGYGQWISDLVKEYSIDGLRIDAAKHVQVNFWPEFSRSAGVFCMGEVFGSQPIQPIAAYQGINALDSVLNYPLYSALVDTFAIPGAQNMSALVQVYNDSKTLFSDVTVLGNFLENQDNPRWQNLSVDPQSLYNAMTFTFMSDGIPIVYYGQEQYFNGSADPFNREPLWTSGYKQTDAYKFMTNLNKFRNFLINSTSGSWAAQQSRILAYNNASIAIMKGSVISIMTNIGSPPQNGTYIAVNSTYPAMTTMIDIVSCKQWVTASKGMLEAQYTKGGVALVLIPMDMLNGSGLCGETLAAVNGTSGGDGGLKSSALGVKSGLRLRPPWIVMVVLFVLGGSVWTII